jgi:hypothetical protein
VSYSLFGFVFGNRVIRFLLHGRTCRGAFCFFRFPKDWLDIRFLYLVSVSFQMILATGTVLAARLLYQRPWRRRLPFLIPWHSWLCRILCCDSWIIITSRKPTRRMLDNVKAKFYEEYARRTATTETLPHH